MILLEGFGMCKVENDTSLGQLRAQRPMVGLKGILSQSDPEHSITVQPAIPHAGGDICRAEKATIDKGSKPEDDRGSFYFL